MGITEKLERAFYLYTNRMDQAALAMYSEVLTDPEATEIERVIAFFRIEMIHRPEGWNEAVFKQRIAALKLKEAGYTDRRICKTLEITPWQLLKLMKERP